MFYKEVQYFRRPWLVLLLAAIFSINLWGLVQQVGMGIPWGNNPAPDWLLIIIFIIFGLALPLFVLGAHLEVAVLPTGLRYRFFPIHMAYRAIPWSEVAAHSVIDYRPMRDFGGWGIRYGSIGKAYTVSGNCGVLIVLNDGRKVVFGSRKAWELSGAISSAKDPRAALPNMS
jgi:hypothetical protein